MAREALRLDAEEQRKRDGIFQAADQPGGRARKPAADLGLLSSSQDSHGAQAHDQAPQCGQDGNDGEHPARRDGNPGFSIIHYPGPSWRNGKGARLVLQGRQGPAARRLLQGRGARRQPH